MKLNDTLDFLKNLKANEEDIKKTADDATKEALTKVDAWIIEVQRTADKVLYLN